MNNESEPTVVMPQPARDWSHKPAIEPHPGTGVIASQQPVVRQGNVGDNAYNANDTYTPPRQRIQNEVIPTLPAIRSDIAQLRDQVAQSQVDFDGISLDDWYAGLHASRAKVARLRAELAVAEAELKAEEAKGSPTDTFRHFVIDAEQSVMSFSKLLYARLLDDASLATFKIPASRLSQAVKKDLGLHIEDRLRKFEAFKSLFRNPNAGSQQVKAAAARVADALTYLINETK